VRQEGITYPVQPYAMRAPEVYQGVGCVQKSQVWALAATLICWIKPGVFGTAGNTIPLFHEGWSVSKLLRLFPDWDPPPIEHAVRRTQFALGKHLVEHPVPEMSKILSLEEELEGMDMPAVLRDLFRYLLVVDPARRPSASEVLASPEYQALEQAALASTSRGN
jgi:serine/threonine protein kinase